MQLAMIRQKLEQDKMSYLHQLQNFTQPVVYSSLQDVKQVKKRRDFFFLPYFFY